MADLEISQLPSLPGAQLSATDPLPLADLSAAETKRITAKDLIQYGIALIDDGSIPGAKVSSTLPAGSIDTAELANDAVTGIKLADDSTCFVGASLPASGEYEGQLALTIGDNKIYAWNGSTWVSVLAAGSVNSLQGSTSAHATVSVAVASGVHTITVTLVNSTAANQFFAGPSNAAGAISLRQIVPSDLPLATTSTIGGVSVASGEGIRLAAGAGTASLEIDNDITASANYHVVTYSDKGLILAGRAISAADLPIATSSNIGAIKNSSEFTVNGSGVLNHTNQLGSGATATKVTYDAQGHITASQALIESDIPNLSTSKITTGTFATALFGTNSITGTKLANESTVQFGGAGSTAGVVTFPAADFKGQYFFDEINQDLYIWSGSAWLPITIISGELIYGGAYNASTNQVASVTSAGSAAGLTVGAALPAASTSNNRYYLVVSQSGTGTGNAPAVALAPPDMILSNGATWDLIDVSNAIAGQTASNISFTPYGGIVATNVQTAIQELDDEKLNKAGGTVTGQLLIGTTGSVVFEGSTADDYETTLAVVDPTADRTITLPNASGTVVLSGAIANADIAAGAAIADSKLATISTAGKVDNSATTAASANTASAIVARDASGNFSAGTISAALTGNASTATALATARNIQGVAFDGTANITVVTAGSGISVTGTAVANTGVLSVNGNTGAITNVAVTNTAQSFSAAQRGTVSALTDGATITPDFAVANNFSVTLGGNRTLANPSNLTAGQSGTIVITQDGTGSRTLAYGSNWKFPGGTAPTLTTTASAVDVIAYYVESASRITARLISDVK